jgi:allophanate hydrolase subunit 2
MDSVTVEQAMQAAAQAVPLKNIKFKKHTVQENEAQENRRK